MNRKIRTIKLFSLEQGLELIRKGRYDFYHRGKQRWFKFGSRKKTFLKHLKCPDCGKEITHFKAEHDPVSDTYSFNAYCSTVIKGALTEVLFNVDHIIPKARGGSDASYNLRTMCAPCNAKKGDKALC